MKMSKAWRLGVGDVQVVRGPRQCPHMRRPLWIIVLVSMGHEGRFSVYVHASKEKPIHVSQYFYNHNIRSDQLWGKISMIDAERRLLANALQDLDNQHFVLLSDSCVPLYNFDYIYNYLMYTNISFVDCFEDPGPHGSGRYSEHMLPEIEKNDFRKGGQLFSIKRQHALVVTADSLYYSKFRHYCKFVFKLHFVLGEISYYITAIKSGYESLQALVPLYSFGYPLMLLPGLEGRNCIADEHYLPTFLHLVDSGGISNWSVTHVDWSERKWHPKSYKAEDVTHELLRNITSIDESVHVTSDQNRVVQRWPCLWNVIQRPCYLFARKFFPETLDNLLHHFANYTTVHVPTVSEPQNIFT